VDNLGSVTVNVPGDGFVVLFFSGTVIFFGDSTEIQFGLGSASNLFDLSSIGMAGRLDGAGTARFRESIQTLAVVPVTAGVRTFYANAYRLSVFSANSVNMGASVLAALFVPKGY
jgi:hypothetical protein